MAKKKNKSRLTKTDVNAICEMQRKIVSYEMYFQSIMINLGNKESKVVVLMDTPMDEVVSMIYRRTNNLKELIKARHIKDSSLEESASGQ